MALTLSGLISAVWLASQSGKWNLLWLYPFAVIVLILYSRVLKCIPVVGNLVISLLCAGVFGSIALLEWAGLVQHIGTPDGWSDFWLSLMQFTWIAFLLTWAREMTKDLEDLEGDRESGCHTLPIAWGEGRTRWLIVAVLILCIASIIIWMRSMQFWWELGYVGILMVLPLAVMVTVLWTRYDAEIMQKASKHIKWVMLHAIIYLIFIP